MAFIFTTVAIDMIGIGLIIPSLPQIMRRFTDDPATVSEYFGFFISVYALMQFIASPLLGVLSDALGRRSVLLVSLAVAAGDYILMALAPTLTWLFVGRVIAGLTGANITVAMSYISDISDDANRSARFGMIGAAFGLGFVVGPAIGGLLGSTDVSLPFYVAAGINGINFLFGLWILPESLPKERRRKFTANRANPLRTLAGALRDSRLTLLLIVHFLVMFAGQTHPSIWALYTGYRFGWGPKEVGLSLAVVGIAAAVAQGALTGPMIKKLGEYQSVLLGTAISMVTFLAYGFATAPWVIFMTLVVASIGWVAGPALNTLISGKTPANEQGELQGTLVSLSSLSAILNPIVATQLFSFFTDVDRTPILVPGAPYFFAAMVSFSALFVMIAARRQAGNLAQT